MAGAVTATLTGPTGAANLWNGGAADDHPLPPVGGCNPSPGGQAPGNGSGTKDSGNVWRSAHC